MRSGLWEPPMRWLVSHITRKDSACPMNGTLWPQARSTPPSGPLTSEINADLGLLKDDAAYRTATAASLGLIHSEVQQAIIEAMADGSETLAHSEATSLQLTRHQARALAARLHGIVQEFEEDPEAASAGVETQEDPSERSAAIYTGLVALAPLRRRPDAHQ